MIDPPPGLLTVKWTPWPPKRTTSRTGGPTLTEIRNALPTDLGEQYECGGDDVTTGHETTHGINSAVRNSLGVKAGYYVGGQKAVVVPSPPIKLADVARAVPQSVRGDRYSLYLESQASQWNDDPLYVFDEWTAYTNGAAVGLEITEGGSDAMVGPVEFVAYGLAVAIAAGPYDDQFVQFLRWQLQRACWVYKTGIVMPQWKWERDRENALRICPQIKDVLAKFYGDSLTIESLLGDRHEPSRPRLPGRRILHLPPPASRGGPPAVHPAAAAPMHPDRGQAG